MTERDVDEPAAAEPATPANHGLIGTEELAEHYGISEAAARRLMSDFKIPVVRGYPRDAALGVQRPGRRAGPGRGHKGPHPATDDGAGAHVS